MLDLAQYASLAWAGMSEPSLTVLCAVTVRWAVHADLLYVAMHATLGPNDAERATWRSLHPAAVSICISAR